MWVKLLVRTWSAGCACKAVMAAEHAHTPARRRVGHLVLYELEPRIGLRLGYRAVCNERRKLIFYLLQAIILHVGLELRGGNTIRFCNLRERLTLRPAGDDRLHAQARGTRHGLECSSLGGGDLRGRLSGIKAETAHHRTESHHAAPAEPGRRGNADADQCDTQNPESAIQE